MHQKEENLTENNSIVSGLYTTNQSRKKTQVYSWKAYCRKAKIKEETWSLRNLIDYVQKPQRNCSFMHPISGSRGKLESVTHWILELTNWQTLNAKLMKENYRVTPWIVLYKFNYSPKLTIEPLPRMMAGGRGGGAGRSKLSDNGRTIFKIRYLATVEQQFVLKIC